jgi:hypothetical protein
MAAIALRLAIAALAFAQITSRFNDTIAAMASALAENNPDSFLANVDKNMPGYEQLKSNVKALTAQADVHSGIDQIIEEGNEVTVTWEMRIDPINELPDVQSERRVQTLHLKFAQDGKRWKLNGLDHIEFFEPPRAAK